MQLTNIVRTISLIGAFVLAATTARAVDPPPDGGYPAGNTAEGDNALLNLTSGLDNTAVGFDTLFSNTTGSDNTANGSQALVSNTTGFNNTAIGRTALQSNVTGNNNTATGFQTLPSNTTGSDNTANGTNALFSNTTGMDNTATGSGALQNNTADNNTATGFQALNGNTTGGSNTATGGNVLVSNTIGMNNTATGGNGLQFNTTGNNNTADGVNVLSNNTTGNFNTADGVSALGRNTTGINNTATGGSALSNNTTGSSNIVMGFAAGFNLTTGSNNIDIGSAGVAGESSRIRIGTKPAQKATFIAGISGVTVANGVGVIINSQGQLGTVVSSERFKDAIKPMEKASEVILALQPVTFRYKHELDPTGIPQFGLVAEQVEKVDPDLVARDEQGKPYTVRYEAVNAMLLNEFLKEHRKVEEQEHKLAVQDSKSKEQNATIIELKSALAQQQQQIGLLTSQMQRVSDQLTANETAPAMVVKNR
jgi:uncharacterized coiled-coil protein SlyX